MDKAGIAFVALIVILLAVLICPAVIPAGSSIAGGSEPVSGGSFAPFRWVGAWLIEDAARREANAELAALRVTETWQRLAFSPTPRPTSTPWPTPTSVPALVQTTRTLGDAIAPLILPGLGIALVVGFFVMMMILDRRSRAFETPAGQVFERSGAYLRSGNLIGPGVVVEQPSAIRYGWWWARRNLHRLAGMEFDELAPATTTQVHPIDRGATAEQYAAQARAAIVADGLAGAVPRIPKGVTHLTLPPAVPPAALPAQSSRQGADVWSVESGRPGEQLELMTGLLGRLGLQAPAARTTYTVDGDRVTQ